MKNFCGFIISILLHFGLYSQNQNFYSIHEEQNEYFKNSGLKSQADFDSVNHFELIPSAKE
ncbi:MAG: hypothetical protein K8R68_06510, partial [Bacteroidales bacterium]|nr:hypothetical protein [Bacteroidales bacterium]